ncbi:PleD family two-component system response regulator, partial [uncultured Methanofollis sp.]|uniref:response regulator n=1 Tax=uncultured Methanofollis sp. TaxID=262500 RepID=UPI002604E418
MICARTISGIDPWSDGHVRKQCNTIKYSLYQNEYYPGYQIIRARVLKKMPRILITDDSSFQRKIISSFLLKEGFETVCARNGREGLDLATENPPDLIILDLLMPEMDGFEMM